VLAIFTGKQNGSDLLDEELYIQDSKFQKTFQIIESKQIGVRYAKDWADKPLRFYIKVNPFV
jgi:DNA-3-methyladenine glycosylase